MPNLEQIAVFVWPRASANAAFSRLSVQLNCSAFVPAKLQAPFDFPIYNDRARRRWTTGIGRGELREHPPSRGHI